MATNPARYAYVIASGLRVNKNACWTFLSAFFFLESVFLFLYIQII